MVANRNKLRGKMAENEVTVSKLAEYLELAEATVRLKINSDKYEFTLSESIKIKALLNLTDAEYLEIFIYF
jgi:DNA-binding XRE family transcriptional regulator